MAFFSCVAWLYVAGRLWQDAENRKLLANLLKRNIEQKPKILTIEDKLMVLGCKDLERRIVEVEMDLTLAKSQGYLKHQLPQSESSSQRKLLAVIGVYTGFGRYLKRNTFRGSWMPREGLIGLLEHRRHQDSAYIGCMKSGEVVSEEGKLWYEPEWWKFGDEKSYFRHASGSLIILSKNLAHYINTNSASLKTYAHDDISVGSWMMGVQAIYIDDNRLCCSSIRQDKVCSVA
ncbi:hypothetical protein ES319_A08G272700v1 [Gossypium barbadense]|uniref:Hexosyltransferase n=4 Tax=Gossypium TaxID=3633 RepID=A0A5J5UXK7_GOSBA|nr:hypothetical protein ES319_A08G272700v1 [Gossypium barbadense]